MSRTDVKANRPNGIPRHVACAFAHKSLRYRNSAKIAQVYLNDPEAVVVGMGYMNDAQAVPLAGFMPRVESLAMAYAVADGLYGRPVRGIWYLIDYPEKPGILVIPDYQKTAIAEQYGLC